MTTLNIAVTIVSAWVYTELAGYWLHRLLHSEKIPYLSRSHMIHHLVLYAPNKPQRPCATYLVSTDGRASLLGIGMEWLAPVAVIMAATVAGLTALGVPAALQALFLASASLWGWFMFGYVHDRMHLKGFWLAENKWLAPWFTGARRLHDIHHINITDDGREATNFGMCFFFFDRLFGTFKRAHARFNRAGYEAAKKRYSFIYPAGTAA